MHSHCVIDPGLNGAIVYFEENRPIALLQFKESVHGIYVNPVAAFIEHYKPQVIYIEEPPKVPNQSVKSTARQWFILGQVATAAETYCERVEFLLVRSWSSFCARLSTEPIKKGKQIPKKLSKELAKKYFPEVVEKVTGPRGGIHDGVTDCLCMQIYLDRDKYIGDLVAET